MGRIMTSTKIIVICEYYVDHIGAKVYKLEENLSIPIIRCDLAIATNAKKMYKYIIRVGIWRY